MEGMQAIVKIEIKIDLEREKLATIQGRRESHCISHLLTQNQFLSQLVVHPHCIKEVKKELPQEPSKIRKTEMVPKIAITLIQARNPPTSVTIVKIQIPPSVKTMKTFNRE